MQANITSGFLYSRTIKHSLLCIAMCVAVTLCCTLPCSAIVLNNDYFAGSGGDTNNVAGTLDAGYADAQAYSYQAQFQCVGGFGICTGTWIGNDEENNKTYFLTAAHCFEGSPRTPTRTVNTTFTDYSGVVSVSGEATFYLPPERVSPPPGFGGASTDIGILEFDGQVEILSPKGNKIFPAAVYDGNQELGHEVSLVGYGSWGIGTQGSDGGLFPSSGPRRAGGTNVISNIFEQSHGISANFNSPGSGDFTPREVSVASGDSGSAWWQEHDGRWSVIGTTNGGSGTSYGTFSTAARASQYVDWIQSIYADVVLFSDLQEITADINNDGLLTGDGTGDPANDDVSAFVANWRGVSTPQSINPADLNIDGIVDLRDFWHLREAFANRIGRVITLADAFGSQPVPEPSALLLASLSIVSLVHLRW